MFCDEELKADAIKALNLGEDIARSCKFKASEAIDGGDVVQVYDWDGDFFACAVFYRGKLVTAFYA